MSILGIVFALTMVGDIVAQSCYFDNCPSPPVHTIIAEYDGGVMNCVADFEYTFEFVNCDPANAAAIGAVLDVVSVTHPVTNAVWPINVVKTATGAEAVINAGDITPSLALGSYQMTAELPGATSDPSKLCEFTLVVQETHSLACNDDVNIALDASCQANILVDMILEGEVVCYDDYTIAVDGFTPAVGEVIVDAPGTYGVTITSPSGQSCWSTIEVEDKLSQPLFCHDIEAPCSQDHSPGQQILNFKNDPTINTNGGVVQVQSLNDNMTPADASDDFLEPDTLDVEFDFGLAFTDTLIDLEVILDLATMDVSTMEVFLVCPNPMTAADTLRILDLNGNACHEEDLFLELADDHFLPHDAFDFPLYCNNGVNGQAHQGMFKPMNALSYFNGKAIQGTWKLLIVNHSEDHTITVNSNTNITATYGSGVIGFPITGADVSWVPTGPNEYDVFIANNNCGPYTASYVDSDFDMCEGFTRTWTLRNGVGLSASCDQSIVFSPNPTIVFPGNFDGFEYPAFNCSDIVDGTGAFLPNVLDANGNISPEVTGYPQSEFGDIDLCGRFQISYTDTRLDICGNSYKILRSWTIVDWCLNNLTDPNAIVEHLQVLKIEDVEGPIISCPVDTDGSPIPYQISSDPYTCTATWLVELPELVIDCGVRMEDYAFKIAYLIADSNGNPPENGVYEDANVTYGANGNPISISGLPVGRTWLKYTVEDDCGNFGYCFTEIDVVDEADPFAVCLEHTVATLGPTGCVIVKAPSFDNGSWDNCGPVSFKARIATGTIDLVGYQDSLKFCCGDCGKTYPIDLLVTDLAGNTSSCTVDIDIIDNLPPVQNGLPQQFVQRNCIDGPVTAQEWYDTYVGDFDFIDNCQSSFVYTLEDVSPAIAEPNECGDNSYTFKWTVSNDCGEDFVYDQFLTFVNALYPTVLSFPADLLNLTECANNPTPEALNGYPVISNDACAQVAVTYDDQIFNNVDNACIKILRTWTVIDWCRYDPNVASPEGISSHVQTIKIVDNDLPIVTCGSFFTVEGTTSDCHVNTDDDNFILEAYDECTTEVAGLELVINWEILSAGTVVYSGSGNDANGRYEYGTYVIKWYVEDHCGNLNDLCSYPFEIVDVKKPTPYCLGTVVTATMEDPNAGVEIWASDFDLGGTDNYTGVCNQNELDVFFLDGTTKVYSTSFDCSDMPNGSSSTIFLDVWYEDDAGNRDFCTVTLVLQDNENDACEGAGSRMIQGRVRTEEHVMVENVIVEIDANQPEYPDNMITGTDGKYEFVDLAAGVDYTVTSERNDNVLNGVSTLDIVLIQKHILGIQQLDSEYKVIAADANNSGSVSAIDLIEIRKVILGINQEYPNNQESWRFVDATQSWSNPMNPFPYDDIMDYLNFNSSMFGQDIVAVKIGDVNNNAVVNFNQETVVDSRSSAVTFIADNQNLKAGSQVEVPVYSGNFTDMMGYQFTLKSTDAVDIKEIKSGALTLDESNLGWSNIDRGIVTTSWNNSTPMSADYDEVLFTIVLDVNDNVSLLEALTINSDVTSAEAYDVDLNIQDIELEMRNGDLDIKGQFELYQNVPNPFDHSTEISFNLPVSADITLTVYDVNGKVIKVINNSYDSGKQTIRLLGDDLNNHTGLMYYQIETDGFMETKKMIHIK